MSYQDEISREKRKDLGVYYTQSRVVDCIVRGARSCCGFIGEDICEAKILDPAVGSGAFLEGLRKIGAKNVTGFEIDEVAADISLRSYPEYSIFVKNTLEKRTKELYNIVIGNPPYNIKSKNKSDYILNLIKPYKDGLGEKKINLDDDYIKFIRFAEDVIERRGSGVVAMITNNSFLSGVTHRVMRRHLRKTFDVIYILNLHGSGGATDENIFAIKQPVSIMWAAKYAQPDPNKAPAKVFYKELFGRREEKLTAMEGIELDPKTWTQLQPDEKYEFFVPKDFSEEAEYNEGFSIPELFVNYNSGIKTDRDGLFIEHERDVLQKRIEYLLNGQHTPDFVETYNVHNSSSYKLLERLERANYDAKFLTQIQYRPFDYRCIYYDENLVSRPAYRTMQHLLGGGNVGLVFVRSVGNSCYKDIFITDGISDGAQISTQSYVAPLYLNPDALHETRQPNLDQTLWARMNETLGHETTPEEILAYIYAVLHTPSYRTKYAEMLKIDFPRVPYPTDQKRFDALVTLGQQLIDLHLLKISSKTITDAGLCFGEDASLVVSDKSKDIVWKKNRVYINKTAYFDGISETAWTAWIGCYQPAQSWLKYRKSRELTSDDIEHYLKICYALDQTQTVMEELDSHFA